MIEKIKQLFCNHSWKTRLILSCGRNTHNDIKTCRKCGKRLTSFSGNRQEWYAHHGLEQGE